MFSIKINVGPELISPTYNHVHHGKVFSVLEEARIRLLEEIGFPNHELLTRGIALVITRVEVGYKRELKEGEYTVTCENPRVEERSIILHQKILNDKGKVAVEGDIYSMAMNCVTRRGMYLPPEFMAAFLALK